MDFIKLESQDEIKNGLELVIKNLNTKKCFVSKITKVDGDSFCVEDECLLQLWFYSDLLYSCVGNFKVLGKSINQ